MPRLVRRRWSPESSPFGGRRARVAYDYDAYVPDPIAGADFAFRADVAAAVSDAEGALRLAAEGPSFAGFETLSRHMLRAESLASSRIEGLVISHRRLAEAAAAPVVADDTARSVLGNIAAMERAVAKGGAARPLRRRDLIEIHSVLLSATRDSHFAGRLRTSQNWIGGRSDGPYGAEFVPPPEDLVPSLIDDLVSFCNRDDLPPVAQAAIAHAQFETIHPFADGNGRVGRCLVHAVLRRRGLAPRVVPPVSLVLAGDARAYVAGLTAYRRGDADAWIAAFAAATLTAVARSREFGERVHAAVARWRDEVGARRGSLAERTAEALPDRPILDVRTLATHLGCTSAASSQVLAKFAAAGILTATTLGRRNRAWAARGVFELLNEFERELLDPPGRRGRLRAPRRGPTRMPGPEIGAMERRVLDIASRGATSLSSIVDAIGSAAPARRVRVALYRLRALGLVRLAGRARTATWSATAAGRDALTRD